MKKSMMLVTALAVAASAVIAAPKQTGKAAAKAKAPAMTCPMAGGMAAGAEKTGKASAMGGCCGGMMAAPTKAPAGAAGKTAATAPPAAVSASALTVRAKARTSVVGANQVEIVLQSGGTPVSGATVTVASNMTTMNMGTEKVVARETAPGQYRATVHFSMAGPWRIIATAKKGGQTATTTTDLNAK